jgi:hypothetical protein
MKKLGVPIKPSNKGGENNFPVHRPSKTAISEKFTQHKPSSVKRAPHETAATIDENLKVKATLERGDGRYVKGVFNKKNMINFKLNIAIQNLRGLKIIDVVTLIKGKNAEVKKQISTALKSITEFDLPTDVFGGHIEASVVVTYKIGIFKSKQIKTTVSKNF